MKSCLLLMISLSFANHSYSQQWPPLGAQWHFTQPLIYYQVNHEIIEAVKDTMIDSVSCIKLELTCCIPEVHGKSHEYVYGEERKVYHYLKQREKFGLLYDFSKNTGESWMLETDFGDFEIQVDSTFWVQVGDTTLKAMKIDDGGYAHFYGTIVEHIGHMQYFFPLPGLADPVSGPFRCYEDHKIGLFQYAEDGQIIPCDTIYSPFTDNILAAELHGLNLYPNPFNEKLQISNNSGAASIIRIQLYSNLGRNMYEISFQYPQPYWDIDTGNFLPGLYIIEVDLFDGRKAIGKLLKL